MIHSINLSNSYMVPFGPGSALIKCRLITLTQMGARGTYSRAVPLFASTLKNYFGILNLKWSWASSLKSQSPSFACLVPFSLTCSLCPLRLKSQNKETRASIIILENMAKGFHQSGSEIGIILCGAQWHKQPAIQRMNEVIWSLRFLLEFEIPRWIILTKPPSSFRISRLRITRKLFHLHPFYY